MKNFISIFLIFWGVVCNAQSQELLNHTWYLQKITIHGTDMYHAVNEEVASIAATFSATDFYTSVCNYLSGNLSWHSDNSFTIDDFAVSLVLCQYAVNSTFEDNYFFVFLGENWNPDIPFHYEITQENNILKLTVTSNSGNQAVYYSEYLSVKELDDGRRIKISPNPASGIVKIAGIEKAVSAQLFDLQGKIIFNKKLNPENCTAEIDISNYLSGVYLLVLLDKNGKKLFSGKIVKE